MSDTFHKVCQQINRLEVQQMSIRWEPYNGAYSASAELPNGKVLATSDRCRGPKQAARALLGLLKKEAR